MQYTITCPTMDVLRLSLRIRTLFVTLVVECKWTLFITLVLEHPLSIQTLFVTLVSKPCWQILASPSTLRQLCCRHKLKHFATQIWRFSICAIKPLAIKSLSTCCCCKPSVSLHNLIGGSPFYCLALAI